jgi:hypothetical protein
MAIDREKILAFIRSVGPVVPMQIAKELKIESIFAGAALSELVATNKLKISTAKIGGSPVYYLPEQAPKLVDLYRTLNDKDKQAYDYLKAQQIVRDTDLSPIQRVSMRTMKDFAKQVDVSVGPEKVLFWKWYLVPDDEVEKLIKKIFDGDEAPAKKPEAKADEIKPEQAVKSAQVHATEPKTETKHEAVSEPKPEPKAEHPEPKAEPAKPKPEPKKRAVQKKLEDTDEMLKPLQPEVKSPREPTDDSLFDKTKEFFNSKGIDILNVEIIKKSLELDFIITVPSAVGNIKYYCKARAKKKIAETDLAAVFVKGQVKKLPALLVTTGELNKRAKEMLSTDFEGLKVSQI